MPLRDVTLRVGNQSHTPGNITIRIVEAGETYHMDPEEFRSRLADARDRDELLFSQILLRLDAAGVNPRTATVAQIRTAIESGSYRL